MHIAKLVREPIEAEVRLKELFGVSRDRLQEVALAVNSARADAVPNDPLSARGQFMYIHGTRVLREVFLALDGWQVDRTNNIESVYNPTLNVKVVYQSTETAATLLCPKAVSAKGPASEEIIDYGQTWLFPDMAPAEKKVSATAVWYLCCAVSNGQVTAELSRPTSLVDSQFDDFHERIFIMNPGEHGTFDPNKVTDGIKPQDFEINVLRK